MMKNQENSLKMKVTSIDILYSVTSFGNNKGLNLQYVALKKSSFS